MATAAAAVSEKVALTEEASDCQVGSGGAAEASELRSASRKAAAKISKRTKAFQKASKAADWEAARCQKAIEWEVARALKEANRRREIFLSLSRRVDS